MVRHRFKAKKKRKNIIGRLLIIIILIYIVYIIINGIFSSFKLATSNQEFIEKLLQDSNHHMLYEKKHNDMLSKLILKISNVNLEEPLDMLESVFGYEKEITEIVYNEENEEVELDLNNYIEDPNPIDVNNPRVYIYNSHQLEGYSSSNFEEYNITPNVMMASYLLKEKLNKKGISTIVETSSITDFLNINGWNYASSYNASRFYLLDTMNKYPSLELIIDLHRDSINRDLSTVTIDNKNYAKVLFVVGLEHSNYEPNLNLSNKLNEMIKTKYPGLSRGVMKKSGAGVNGIYNQDAAPYVILIECGSHENSIEEVMNTIEALSNIIYEYLGDNNEI